MSSYRSIPWKQWTSAPCGASVHYFQGMERYSDILLYVTDHSHCGDFNMHVVKIQINGCCVILRRSLTNVRGTNLGEHSDNFRIFIHSTSDSRSSSGMLSNFDLAKIQFISWTSGSCFALKVKVNGSSLSKFKKINNTCVWETRMPPVATFKIWQKFLNPTFWPSPTPSPGGAWNVREVWAIRRWTYSPSLVTAFKILVTRMWQTIRFWVTATLRRSQINQVICSKSGIQNQKGHHKILIIFVAVWRFGKLFLIRNANNFN